jgi:hypothetical protein
MAILQETTGLTNEDLKKIRSMRPGRTVDLQINSAGTSKRVKTEFVGMDNTKSLIFKYPDQAKWGALDNGIYQDRTIIIRYILEDETGEIIAFKVKVLLVITKPSHLFFTSFPVAIQSHDLRAERRAQTSISTTMFDAKSDEVICGALVLDISVHGCRIKLDKKARTNRPKLRQVIAMYFAASKDKQLYLTGTIMNSKSDEVNLYFGVKFETPETQVSQLLSNLMLTID